MKFTGQVRVPEIDHPGVPATVLVEDDQVEVFLEGESLGRWSLFDVQASRLVSSAFSLSMDGEEITFIADEPVDFAYRGVDHMAEVWARYKSMAIPRRVVAVGRSRRGTVASRIVELRTAMMQNLEAAGRGVPILTPIEAARHRPAGELPVHDVPAARARLEPDETAARDRVFRPSPVREPGIDAKETAAPSPRPSGLRPGPGLFRTIASMPPEPIEEVTDTAAVFAEPDIERAPSSSPWDEPIGAEPEPMPSPIIREEALEPEPDRLPEPEIPDRHPEPEVRELVKELLSTSSDEGGEESARDLVVDLGHYEGRKMHEEGPGDVPPPEPAKQPVFTGGPAPAAPVERGGLLGAVRSAFARNKVTHEHEFVEAPGGIGIVRQICAECGYISIGVSD